MSFAESEFHSHATRSILFKIMQPVLRLLCSNDVIEWFLQCSFCTRRRKGDRIHKKIVHNPMTFSYQFMQWYVIFSEVLLLSQNRKSAFFFLYNAGVFKLICSNNKNCRLVHFIGRIQCTTGYTIGGSQNEEWLALKRYKWRWTIITYT